MSAFIVIGALMTLVAVLCVVRPLARSREPADQGVGRQSNVSILRDNLAELEADLRAGSITPEHFSTARTELERRVLEETTAEDKLATTQSRRGRPGAWALAAFMPVAALGLYLWIGAPDALRGAAVATAEEHVKPGEVEEMVGRLAARLEKNPDDPRGWMMLGRSYYVLQRMPEAAEAYAKAAEKITDDADLLADYADALAMSQGRRIEGKPLELVRRALKLDPAHPKALAMAGTEAFNRKDYPAALAYWEKLLPLLPAESEMAKSVIGGIAEARGLGGLVAQKASGPSSTPKVPTTKTPTGKPPESPASVAGTVTLAPALAQKARPDDILFIVARAVDGPRIPLAVLRKRVADLPLDFVLDDSLAMSPQLKLSSFSEVVVTARISKSGNAMSQPGDVQGASGPVKVGAKGLAILIDTVVP